MGKFICECEDFPCCGHSREDRFTTWEAVNKRTKRELRQMEEDGF